MSKYNGALQGPIVAYVDHAPFFEEALQDAMPSLGVGLRALPGGQKDSGQKDSGLKMDLAHLLIMRLSYKATNQANSMAGMIARSSLLVCNGPGFTALSLPLVFG